VNTRRVFMRSSAAIAAATMIPAARAQGAKSLDRLTDASGKYEAAPLPFAYDALEPVIDARTVELHYNFHHKPAAAAANRAEEALAKARDAGDFAQVTLHERSLAYQLSSHILHTLYWSTVSGKGGEAKGGLAKLIDSQYGSFAKFKTHLTAATTAVEASGWGIAGYHPATKKLMILQVENHQKLTAWGVVPVLALDVFEHAYYLKYQNKRPDYVNALFNIVNWDNVAERLGAAQA
jgi:Fe-Mn family superoxide dismutase